MDPRSIRVIIRARSASMMIDLLFLGIFLTSVSCAILLIWKKIPLLLSVPQQLIEESFVTRPSYLKTYLGRVMEFFRSGRHRELYYAGLVRMLHWVRLWLLRLERMVFRMLEALQERSRELTATKERYWSELKTWKHEGKLNGKNSLPDAVLNSEPPPEVKAREIRRNGNPLA